MGTGTIYLLSRGTTLRVRSLLLNLLHSPHSLHTLGLRAGPFYRLSILGFAIGCLSTIAFRLAVAFSSSIQSGWNQCSRGIRPKMTSPLITVLTRLRTVHRVSQRLATSPGSSRPLRLQRDSDRRDSQWYNALHTLPAHVMVQIDILTTGTCQGG